MWLVARTSAEFPASVNLWHEVGVGCRVVKCFCHWIEFEGTFQSCCYRRDVTAGGRAMGCFRCCCGLDFAFQNTVDKVAVMLWGIVELGVSVFQFDGAEGLWLGD